MAPAPYNYEYFNVTFPAEYVAHVEINRKEKLNAFHEPYVLRLSVKSVIQSFHFFIPINSSHFYPSEFKITSNMTISHFLSYKSIKISSITDSHSI
jgi:hypothetical protein